MHSFTDNAGRTWVISINVAAVKRVRGLLGVDLYSLVDDGFKPLGELLGDPVKLVDVIYCLCRDEANAKNVSDEDFGRALYGDAITRAADAFVEELIDFFPEARVRESLRKVVVAGKKMRETLLSHVETTIAEIDPEAEAKKLIASFGNSLGSLASTPGHLLSENSA